MFEHYMQGVQPILKMKPVKSMKSVKSDVPGHPDYM